MSEDFKFYIGGTDYFVSTELKSSTGEKKYFVTGYVSTKDLDLVGDVVTDACLKDLAEQINTGNIKLDVDHEVWREGSPDMLPIGRIVEAKYDEGKIWVKAQINSNSDRFSKVWSNIKEKFLDAFSIAYKPINAVRQVVGEKTVRLLEKVQLLNVALTGNPANPGAKITEVFVKSLDSLEDGDELVEIKDSEECVMSEENVEAPVEEAKETVVTPAPAPEGEKVEEKSNEIAELKAMLEEYKKKMTAENDSLKEELKSVKEQLEKPQFKSVQENAPDVVVEKKDDGKIINPLSLI